MPFLRSPESASASPVGAVSESRAACNIEISACEDCTEEIIASEANRKRWTINIEFLPDPEDSETDAWLKVGIRGVGHWHLSDGALKGLGVSFELDFN
jgi:hypothetical protein